MVKEWVEYDNKSGEGFYHLEDANLYIRTRFKIGKDSPQVSKVNERRRISKYDISKALIAAKRKAVAAFYGKDTVEAYRKFIDFTSVWLTPNHDMSSRKNDIEVKEEWFGYYDHFNIATCNIEPNWATSIDGLIDGLRINNLEE